jgi:hypothetical protein
MSTSPLANDTIVALTLAWRRFAAAFDGCGDAAGREQRRNSTEIRNFFRSRSMYVRRVVEECITFLYLPDQQGVWVSYVERSVLLIHVHQPGAGGSFRAPAPRPPRPPLEKLGKGESKVEGIQGTGPRIITY